MTDEVLQRSYGSRARDALAAGEHAARYAWLEESLRGRRVVEIGTDDGRSLTQLRAAGARQVVGTTSDPARLADRGSRTPAVDWVLMESGHVDFPDSSFDVALVLDLARELEARPQFLEDVRRVLSPGGFGLLTVAGRGSAIGALFGAAPRVEIHPERFVTDCRAVFEHVRVLAQVPFVGVGIQPMDRSVDSLELSWEGSYAGHPAEPSHLLILVGAPAPALTERALVELPYTDLCSLADARGLGSEREHARLTRALDSAWSELSAREAALARVAKTLPRLRAAIRSRLFSPAPANEGSEVVAPTVLERPLAEEDEVGHTRVAELSAALHRAESARRSAEARALELAEQSELMERMLQVSVANQTVVETPSVADVESSEAVTVHAEELSSSGRERWISELEPVAHEAERQVTELKQELADRRAVAEAIRAERDDTVRRLETELHTLSGRVAEHERTREELLDKLSSLERASAEAEVFRTRAEAERDELFEIIETERGMWTRGRERSEQLEFELHARSRDIEGLRAAMRERDEALEAVQGVSAALTADRRAVEIAASHLSREVETLRARTKALRNERDTLATAARMLVEERDAALAVAQRGDLLERELEGARADHRVVEQRAATAEEQMARMERRASALERRLVDAEEARRILETERATLENRLREQTAAVEVERSQRVGLDQNLARIQVAAAESARAAHAADDRARVAETHLMDALREAREARVDAARVSETLATKQDEVFTRDQELLEVAALRARERAASAEGEARLVEVRGRAALANARVASLQRALAFAGTERAKAVRTAVAGAHARQTEAESAARENARALARMREEAATLALRVEALERELGEARAVLDARTQARVDPVREDLQTILVGLRQASAAEADAVRAARLYTLAQDDVRQVQGLRFERTLDRAEALEAERRVLRSALLEARASAASAQARAAAAESRRTELVRRVEELERAARFADAVEERDAWAEIDVAEPRTTRATVELRLEPLADALEAAQRARQQAEEERREARARVVELEEQLAARPPRELESVPRSKAPEALDAATDGVPPSRGRLNGQIGRPGASAPRLGSELLRPGGSGAPEVHHAHGPRGVAGPPPDLKEAHAEVARRLVRIREREEGLIRAQRALEDARAEVEALSLRRTSMGDVEQVRRQLELREREIERLGRERAAFEAERCRLHDLVEMAKESRFQREQRIAELEAALVERSRRLDFLSKELAEKTIRLRRLSGRSE